MKATELKIDNLLLLDDDKIIRVLWFKLEVACIMEVGVEYPSAIVSLDRLKPIPLTEEWLLKFGFNKEGNTIYKELNGFEFGTINTNRYKPRFYLQTQGSTSNITLPIKFVHQLQNLYFALTGEELK